VPVYRAPVRAVRIPSRPLHGQPIPPGSLPATAAVRLWVLRPYLRSYDGVRLGAMTENLAAPRTEELGIHECWNLLRSVSVGRLALWLDGQPHIFPLNYVVDHGSLVFRTGTGNKLAGSAGSEPVALEADGVDPVSGVAWSVVAKGHAKEVRPAQEVLETVGLLLFPWEAGRKDHFVRIIPDELTGRRFTVAAPATWWTPLQGMGQAPAE